jgi:hypothetical protein
MPESDKKDDTKTAFGDLTGLAAMRTLNAQAKKIVEDLSRLGDAILASSRGLQQEKKACTKVNGNAAT